MPLSVGTDVGIFLVILTALYPIIRSLGDGISSWINSRRAVAIDAADKLTENSLQWVERFSAELKSTKDELEAMKKRVKELETSDVHKDKMIDEMRMEIKELRKALNEKDATINEKDATIARLRRQGKKGGMLND